MIENLFFKSMLTYDYYVNTQYYIIERYHGMLSKQEYHLKKNFNIILD